MSRGFPSMTALLGLLAIAGYQNRDKIAEILGGLNQNRSGSGARGGRRLPRSVEQHSRKHERGRPPERRSRRTAGPVQSKRPGGNRAVMGKIWSQQGVHPRGA
jgi:hypothetical protein